MAQAHRMAAAKGTRRNIEPNARNTTQSGVAAAAAVVVFTVAKYHAAHINWFLLPAAIATWINLFTSEVFEKSLSRLPRILSRNLGKFPLLLAI